MHRISNAVCTFLVMSSVAMLLSCAAQPAIPPHHKSVAAGDASVSAQDPAAEPASADDQVDTRVQEYLARLHGDIPVEAQLPPQPIHNPSPGVVWTDEAARAEQARQRAQQLSHAEQKQKQTAPDPFDTVESVPAVSQTESQIAEETTEPEQDDTTQSADDKQAANDLDNLDREQLLTLLTDRISQSKDPAIQKALVMAMLSMAAPDRGLDPQILEQLDRQQREQVEMFHTLVVTLGRQLADDRQAIDVNEINVKLNEMFGRPIEIANAVLCKRVNGFASYEEFPVDVKEQRKTYVLVPGRNRRVGLYVELQNFRVTQNADDAENRYMVRLSQQLSLFTHDGVQVWSEPAAEVIDRARARRRDFYTTQVFELPATLPPGKYVLNVRVTDRSSDSIAEQKIPLHLVIPQTLVEDRPAKP